MQTQEDPERKANGDRECADNRGAWKQVGHGIWKRAEADWQAKGKVRTDQVLLAMAGKHAGVFDWPGGTHDDPDVAQARGNQPVSGLARPSWLASAGEGYGPPDHEVQEDELEQAAQRASEALEHFEPDPWRWHQESVGFPVSCCSKEGSTFVFDNPRNTEEDGVKDRVLLALAGKHSGVFSWPGGEDSPTGCSQKLDSPAPTASEALPHEVDPQIRQSLADLWDLHMSGEHVLWPNGWHLTKVANLFR